MLPTTKRKIFAAQFAVIVVPYGFAAIVGLALIVVGLVGPIHDPWERLFYSFAALLIGSYLCGLALSLTYLRKGGTGLSQTKSVLWVLAWIGAATAIVAIVGTFIGHFIPWPFPPPAPEDNPFALAPTNVGQAFAPGLILVPLLIPFAHLLWERSSACSNSSLERTREP